MKNGFKNLAILYCIKIATLFANSLVGDRGLESYRLCTAFPSRGTRCEEAFRALPTRNSPCVGIVLVRKLTCGR